MISPFLPCITAPFADISLPQLKLCFDRCASRLSYTNALDEQAGQVAKGLK